MRRSRIPIDRARTEAAARAQCKQPYVIGAGANGGVIMHLADQATPQELRLKGSPSGKNYIGPAGPAGGEQDREIVSFDGRVLITPSPTRMRRPATAIWSTSAARRAPEPLNSILQDGAKLQTSDA